MCVTASPWSCAVRRYVLIKKRGALWWPIVVIQLCKMHLKKIVFPCVAPSPHHQHYYRATTSCLSSSPLQNKKNYNISYVSVCVLCHFNRHLTLSHSIRNIVPCFCLLLYAAPAMCLRVRRCLRVLVKKSNIIICISLVRMTTFCNQRQRNVLVARKRSSSSTARAIEQESIS